MRKGLKNLAGCIKLPNLTFNQAVNLHGLYLLNISGSQVDLFIFLLIQCLENMQRELIGLGLWIALEWPGCMQEKERDIYDFRIVKFCWSLFVCNIYICSRYAYAKSCAFVHLFNMHIIKLQTASHRYLFSSIFPSEKLKCLPWWFYRWSFHRGAYL